MSLKKLPLQILMISLVLLLVGCPAQNKVVVPDPIDPVDPTPKPPVVEAKLAVEKVGWNIFNYDPTFSSTASARIRFYIDFKNTEIKPEDIKSVEIISEQSSNLSWTTDNPESIKENLKITSTGSVFYQTGRLFSTNYSKNGSVLPLGNYEFLITPTEGEVVKYTHTVPATGSANTNAKKFAFTEDYVNANNPLVDYDPLLKRAKISAAFLDASQTRLTVKFSVNDSRVYAGSVWLYDKDGNYVGYTTDGFRDFKTGTISSNINDGNSIKTGGAENSVVVESPQLTFEDGKAMSDVAFTHVALFDGWQFKDTDATFDVTSISAVKQVDAGATQ